MLSSPIARRARLQICTLLLLLGVFGWGLEYKLSLYQQGEPNSTSANPPAKLLTDAERKTGAAGKADMPSRRAVAKALHAPAAVPENLCEKRHEFYEIVLSPAMATPVRSVVERYFIRPPPIS